MWQYTPLALEPGINVEKTPLLASTNWVNSAAVRFRDGQPEKIGGWAHLNAQTLVGICTGMHSWSDLAGNPYIACGTDQRLELFSGGAIYDITPLRKTDNVTPEFTTTATSAAVGVHDPSNGAVATDWINITIPVSIGGLILQGFYQIQTIVDTDNYTITAASAATSSVTLDGAVPLFTTHNGSGNITVTLDNHGYVAGSFFGVQVSTTVGGITLSVGSYQISSVTDVNNFVIAPGGVASSDDSVSENSGNAQIEYLIHTGLQSAGLAPTSTGYGLGPYGSGPYGTASSSLQTVPLRQWFLDNFGQDLVGNYTNSPVYVWVPPYSTGNVAIPIDTTNYPSAQDPPTNVVFSFVAGPQQMIIAGGCNEPASSTFDPNLLRWCDQGDFTDWTAQSTNQAGSYRIPSGSRLVGGISAPNFTVVWTDIDMWLMNYLGGSGLSELVWGFQKVAGSTGLLSARACAVFRNLVFYASSNGIYMFNGNAITIVPCPVWDKFWKNVDRQQIDKVNMQVNSWFQELSISFPSSSGNGTIDSRITYNIRENHWTYDDAPTVTPRTAWIDENAYGSPAGTDLSGYIQQQDGEGVYDADGAALPASITSGWFSLQEGTLVGFMERLEADLYVTGGTQRVYLTVYTQDYATGPVRQYGPYPWVFGSGPPMAITRARGRFFAIQISSSETGVWWRLGNTRFRAQAAGIRP